MEAAEAAPGSASPARAIAGSRSTKSSLTPAPLAAPATAADDGQRRLDDESREWLHALSVDCRDEALDRLRALILRATRFEVARRRDQLLCVDDRQLDELARTAAEAAAICVLAHLDHSRGRSRFATWAAKFALLEAAVRLRRLAWRETSSRLPYGSQERRSVELRATVGDGIGVLTADQRQVFEALMIDGIPIDVVAERMQTTRGDVYLRLHTARLVLRERLMRAEPV